MHRVFDIFFQDFQDLDLRPGNTPTYQGLSINVDMQDMGDELQVSVEVPGLDADDIEVNISDHSLCIQGEKKQEQTVQNELTSSYRSVKRAIPLPVKVDSTKVQATFKNGVLTVILPKSDSVHEDVATMFV